MRNSELTKETILKKSSILFNTIGYKSTSISKITEATCFTKGAIYRHFESKEILEMESFQYLVNIMSEKVGKLIKDQPDALSKLKAVFKFFETYITNPPFKGGCPILNVAIEVDDSNSQLRKEAVKSLKILKDSVEKILEKGIKYKQISQTTDVKYFATIIVASLEGALMMSRLNKNSADIKCVINHLESVLDNIKI